MAKLLPVKPGTVNAADRALLSEAGFLVFDHPEPAEVNVPGEGSENCDCGSLLGKLIAGISAQIGRDRSVTVSVTAGPAERPWVGPPISESGGVQLSVKSNAIAFTNQSPDDRWIFVKATTGFNVQFTSQSIDNAPCPLPAAQPPTMIRYCIKHGQTMTLTLASPNTVWPVVIVAP
jgi:hypothetical protein